MSKPTATTSFVSPPPATLGYLSTPRYSQSTYLGRVRNFFSVIDPLTLLASDAQVRQACDVLEKYKAGKREGVTQEMIWKARKLKESAVHPDTNDLIFRGFRFSAFVPVNIPLVVGMLSSSTPAGTIFWQWANQSYNVAVNYANRNIGKGKEMSTNDIAASYAGAVISSCSIALGLGKVVEKLNQRPNPGFGIRVFRGAVPFFAVASAGVVNVVLMRRGELESGVAIKDQSGKEYGTSVKAGQKAITEVALTRVALPAPILLFPPIIMSLYDRLPIAKSKPTWRPIVQVPVITACLWLALPFAIGLFPQESSINATELEEKYRNLKDANGRRIEKFYFNKGL